MNENANNESFKESINFEREGAPPSPLDKPPQVVPWHPEKARMALALWVLSGIFFIFLLAIACQFANHLGWLDCGTGNALFELCKTGLLPIVTLIPGYYFSKANND